MLGLLVLTLTWAILQALPTGSAPDGVAEAWVLPAIMAGTSIVSSLLNRNKKPATTPGEAEMYAQEQRDRSRGTAAEDAYLSYLDSYDASKAAEATAGAMSKGWMKSFGRDIEGLRGSQVSRGRLDTGYGMEDEDRYVTDFNENVANQIARLGMQASELNLGAAGQRGQMGSTMVGRATDLAAGRRDQALMDRASKRSMYGTILGSLLQAGGQAYGAYKGAQGG
jgi:hypothetical protein